MTTCDMTTWDDYMQYCDARWWHDMRRFCNDVMPFVDYSICIRGRPFDILGGFEDWWRVIIFFPPACLRIIFFSFAYAGNFFFLCFSEISVFFLRQCWTPTFVATIFCLVLAHGNRESKKMFYDTHIIFRKLHISYMFDFQLNKHRWQFLCHGMVTHWKYKSETWLVSSNIQIDRSVSPAWGMRGCQCFFSIGPTKSHWPPRIKFHCIWH